MDSYCPFIWGKKTFKKSHHFNLMEVWDKPPTLHLLSYMSLTCCKPIPSTMACGLPSLFAALCPSLSQRRTKTLGQILYTYVLQPHTPPSQAW